MSGVKFTLRCAVYLFAFKDDQVLLLRRFNTGWMDGMYSLVAGHIDGNESVNTAMIREAFEEAKIKINNEDLEPATVLHRKSSDQEYIDFFFAVRKWEGQPTIAEPNKCDDLSWFKLNQLPENLLPHVKEALSNYTNKIPFSTSGFEL